MNDFTAAADLLRQQAAGNPFARAAEQLKAQQAGRIGMSIAYDDRDPDAAAKSLAVSRELGVPSLVVDDEPEAYDAQLRMKRAAEALRSAPKTAAWLSDMGNGVLAKDDLDNLTWFERNTGPVGRALGRGARRIPLIEEQGSADTNARVLADVGKTLDDIYKEEIARFGANPPYVVQADARRAAQLRFDLASNLNADDITRIIRSGSDALMRAKERTDQIAAVPMSETATRFRDGVLSEAENTLMGVLSAFASDPLGGAAFTAETATEFVPAMIAASAVTAATRSPGVGAAVMGMASGLTENASSAMELLNEMGVKLETPEDAAAVLQNAEIMKAARERGLSRGLVIGMMDAISGGVAGKQLAKSPIGDMIAQGIAQIGFGAGGEAAGQIAAGQQVSWKDIVIEGLAELATAPIEILGVGGRRLLRETIDAETAGKTATMLADVDTQAMASKLRERAPDKFKEALDAQGLGDKAVYVPADALREYFQAKDMALDDATATAWGIDPIAFEEAAQSGNDVAIPMSNYATYIAGTDAAQWFAENATSDPDEMSVATAKAFNDAVQDVMQEAFYEAERARLDMEEARAADVQIYDQMFSELRAAGRSPDVAQREAQVWTAFWRTMGERYGDDPLSLARSMGVKVLGPQSPEFRRRDQLDIALNTLRTQGAKALKPKGLSLAEFVKAKGGIQDVGGDVAALDPPKGVVAETAKQIRERANQPTLTGVPLTGAGVSLADMGRMAAEAGYFPDLLGEVNAGMNKGEATDFAARLLEALSEDVAGRKVYAEGEGPDANLKALSDALSERGIDIATATNDEIAAALDATDGQQYNQDGTLKTDTPEFRAWFGDSKVVDANGKPLVVYHGGPAGLEELRSGNPSWRKHVSPEQSAAVLDRVFFSASEDVAKSFALRAEINGAESTQVYPVYLSIKNPMVVDLKGKKMGNEARDVPSAAQSAGHDGVIFKNVIDDYRQSGKPTDVYVAFRPEQIKSVYNRGTFDPNDPRILYQPAYHGSPHIFDRFSTDKIGTGEGAQAFGWGLYFAGRKEVAEYYRDTLSQRSFTLIVGGERIGTPEDRNTRFADYTARQRAAVRVAQSIDEGMGVDHALLWARNALRSAEIGDLTKFQIESGWGDVEKLREVVRIIEGWRDADIKIERGRLYKVDIPEDSDLLAWDRPLSEQSEKVREKLAQIGGSLGDYEAAVRLWENAVANPKSRGGDTSAYVAMAQERLDAAILDRDRSAGKTGAEFYAELQSRLGSDRAASEALRDAGIPGHRFLDQGSRQHPFRVDYGRDGNYSDHNSYAEAKAELDEIKAQFPNARIIDNGTYNYVIYDDSAVSVLEFEQGKRGSIVLPSGGLGNGQTVINLFEGADLSTLIHESGHFFLEAFTALASDPSAPQQMRDDLATIREWLGNDGGPLTVEQHEKWARGFEAYVMEGKAPSLALADAFARFKAWLTRIYKTALGLNVKITPEIREVMDRMLATDAEIAAARQEQEMGPLFTSAPPGMSDTDFSTYQRMARRATETAEQRLLDKTMAKVRREKEAWYRAEKKAVTAEVATETDRQPRYRLIDMLANQVWIGAESGVDIPDMQIDRKMLVEQFGEGVLAEISRNRLGGKRAIYGDNGASPQEVAEFFGFPSAEDMISTLQNTPRKRDAVAAEVERRMTERHGDPLNDGSIEEEALAAIHNEQQAQTSVAEARHLATQLGRSTAGMTAKLYRQRARAMVGRMMVRDVIKPERFLASERKAARAAQDAFAKVARGSGASEAALAEALQAKEQQILNGFLYDEARKVAEEVQRGREKMRSYAKKSVREKLEGGYIEQIDAILQDYDFRVRGQGQIARAESLKAFIDRMIEEGREGELNIDERLMDQANRKHYTRLSVDELRGLFDTIDNIDHMGRFKQKLIDRKRARDLRDSADRIISQIRANLGSGKAGKKSRIGAAFNLLWRTDTLLTRMDGGAEIGIAYDEIKRAIDESVGLEQEMLVEMAQRLDKLFKDRYSAADLRKMKVERNIPGANGRPWSKMEILAVALNLGNEDNFIRLTAKDAALPNRLTKENVDALIATMDENDWHFVQDMWDMVNSYWPGLAEVHKRRTGVVPKKVEAKLMVDAPSFVTGGYFPIKYDPTLSAAAASDDASAWDKFTATGRGATAAIRNGMTKQRQRSGNGRTLRLDMSVAFAHMRDTIRYIALSESVDNAYRLITQPDVQNAFLDAGARDQHDILRLWLKDVASGPAPSPDPVNTMARMMKNNFTLSRLALNFKTVALQVTGVGQSAAVIGKKNMVLGYAEYLRDPLGTSKSVSEKSSFMRERRSTFQKDIYDFMDDTQIAGPLSSGYKKSKAALAKICFAPIVWTQFWAVDMPTWLGAFRTGIEKYNGDEAKAAHYADRMVARAQDSGLMSDRAAFERGTLSETTRQSDFVRLFTTLGGYMLTKMNRAYVTSIQAKSAFRSTDSGAQRVAIALNAATDLMMLYVTEAVMIGLIYALMADGEDDDDIRKFLLRETGSALVGGMPFIRDVYSGLMGYGGGGIYGSIAEAPSRFIVQAAQGENDAALRRSIADMVGMVTGLPTTGPMRAIEGAIDSDIPLSEAIFGRNPLNR